MKNVLKIRCRANLPLRPSASREPCVRGLAQYNAPYNEGLPEGLGCPFQIYITESLDLRN